MVVESVSVRSTVHINAIRLVDDKCSFALAVVGDVKLLVNVLQREDVGDGIRVILDSAVVRNVGFHVGGQSPTIAMDSHRLVCLSDGETSLGLQKRSTVD
jgi:hypothetical protein